MNAEVSGLQASTGGASHLLPWECSTVTPARGCLRKIAGISQSEGGSTARQGWFSVHSAFTSRASSL